MKCSPLIYSEDGESATYNLLCPKCGSKDFIATMRAKDLKGWIMSTGK